MEKFFSLPLCLFWIILFSRSSLSCTLVAYTSAAGYANGKEAATEQKKNVRKHETREIGKNRENQDKKKYRRSLRSAGTFPSQFRVQSLVSRTFIRSFNFPYIKPAHLNFVENNSIC